MYTYTYTNRDSEGNTPLIMSASKGLSVDLINVLLGHGANVHAQVTISLHICMYEQYRTHHVCMNSIEFIMYV